MRHQLSCQNVGRDLSRTNGQITDYFECGTSSVARMQDATRRALTDELLTILNAALAQLVERDLAKVEVTSSSLVCRSNFSPKEIVVEIKIQDERRKEQGLILTEPRTQNLHIMRYQLSWQSATLPRSRSRVRASCTAPILFTFQIFIFKQQTIIHTLIIINLIYIIFIRFEVLNGCERSVL